MQPRTAQALVLLATVVAATPVSNEDKIRGAFFGALVSDSMCLGSHYEYDAQVIKQAYRGTISEFMGPGEQLGGTTHGVGWGRRNYHPGQKKGDQTDYGEYNLLMLEYLAGRAQSTAPVDLNELLPVWQDRITNKWGAWICTQTRQTMQQYQHGTPHSQLGGFSNAMAVRSAGVHAVWRSEDEVAAAARAMLFTHRNTEALDGAEFFARVAHKVIHNGMDPEEAIQATAKQMSEWIQHQVAKGVHKFQEATDPSMPLSREEFVDDLAMTSMARLWDVGKTEPIKVGKASPTEGTLPSSVYIILKYKDDFDAAIKANAMVGGDNASRAVAIGLVLGAYHGVHGIPAKLRNTLNNWERSEAMLSKLPLLQPTKAQEL